MEEKQINIREDNKVKKYQEYYVAFLDILGFKALLKDRTCEEIYSIFEILHQNARGKLNLNGVDIQAYKHIHHIILSDSIIIYIKANKPDAFAALVHICNKLQYSLANRDKPILLRGAIAIGDLYHKKDVIYGSGLSSAYSLESNLAKYPRIIFTGDVLERGLENTTYMFPYMEGFTNLYQKDKDSLYFVNYFSPDFWDTNILIKYYDSLNNICNEQLNQAIEEGLRNKYIWLKKKVDKAIKMYPDVEKYYKEIEEKKQEQERLKYNKRFSIYSQQQIKLSVEYPEKISNK